MIAATSKNRDDVVWAVAVVLLTGAVLQHGAVSAGRGIVCDWRTVPSGENLMVDEDAFDVAYLFVALVGIDEVARLLSDVALEPFVPTVTAFMLQANGGRGRSFEIGPFKVSVQAHENDAAQAAFTERLARLSSQALEVDESSTS